MDAQQEQKLISAGDCFLHYHSSDRQATHDTLEQLQQLEIVKTRASPYTATDKDDIILVPGGGTIILPLAKNGGEFQVIMVGSSPVTVELSGTDLIYGETSVILTTKGTALRFKAIIGGWIII